MSRRNEHQPMGCCGSARALAVATALGLLAGCSTLGDGDPKLRVEPVYTVRHSAGSSHGYYLTGRYYDGMRAWGPAIDAYRKAIAADARNIEAYNALGAALAQAGRHAEAEAAFREGLALDPQRAHLRSNLGYMLLLAGRPEEALVQLEAAVRLEPANAIARNNLRQARTQAGVGNDTGAPPAATAVTTSPVAPRTLAPTAPLSSSPAELPAAPRVVDQPTVPAYERVLSAATSGIEIHLPRQVVSLVAVAQATPVAVPAPVAPTPPAAPPDPIGTLEVSNGNGVTGAAARLRRWLAAHDTPTHRLTNQRPFVQRETVIEYRSGHEAAARRLVALLPLADRPATVAASTRLRTDVRIVLGHDWTRIAACIEREACATPAVAMAGR